MLEGASDVSKEFVADMEKRGSSFYLYTPTRTMTLYADTLEAKTGWVRALTEAGHEAFSDDEYAKKDAAFAEMRAPLLQQATIQFERMNVILSNLRAAGFVAEAERVKSKKKGRRRRGNTW